MPDESGAAPLTHGQFLSLARRLGRAARGPDGLANGLAELAQGLGFQVGIAWRPGPDPDVLEVVGAWSASPERFGAFTSASAELRPRIGVSWPGRMFGAPGGLWIEDVSRFDWFERGAEARAVGLRSVLAFCLEGEDGPIGLIELLASHARPEDPVVAEHLGLLADQLSLPLALAGRKAAFDAITSVTERGILLLDQARRITYANARSASAFGLAGSELHGRPLEELVHPRDRGRLAEALDAALSSTAGNPGAPVTVAALAEDGREVALELVAASWTVGGQRAYSLLCEVFGEAELEDGTAIAAATQRLIMGSPAPTLVLRGRDHRVVLMNEASRRTARREGYIGRSIFETVPELERHGYRDLFDLVLRTGEPVSGERAPVVVDYPEGPKGLTFSFHLSPIRDHRGGTTGILLQVLDVTGFEGARSGVDVLCRVHASLTRIGDRVQASGARALGALVSEAAIALEVDALVLSRFELDQAIVAEAWSQPVLGPLLGPGLRVPAGCGYPSDLARLSGGAVRLDYAHSRPRHDPTHAPCFDPAPFRHAIAVPVRHLRQSWGSLTALCAGPDWTAAALSDLERHLTHFAALASLALAISSARASGPLVPDPVITHSHVSSSPLRMS